MLAQLQSLKTAIERIFSMFTQALERVYPNSGGAVCGFNSCGRRTPCAPHH
jgi:hypothetical protein